MTESTIVSEACVGDRRWAPRAGVKVQLISAAIVWLVGAVILVTRGAGYLGQQPNWHGWAVGVALMIGVLKSRYLLDRVATKAVARIRERGRACYFGFFSWKSWLLVGVMMGGGITLRNLVANPGAVASGVMGALYLGIGLALILADRVFWRAAVEEFNSGSEVDEAEEGACA